jgi:hypothetical protein
VPDPRHDLAVAVGHDLGTDRVRLEVMTDEGVGEEHPFLELDFHVQLAVLLEVRPPGLAGQEVDVDHAVQDDPLKRRGGDRRRGPAQLEEEIELSAPDRVPVHGGDDAALRLRRSRGGLGTGAKKRKKGDAGKEAPQGGRVCHEGSSVEGREGRAPVSSPGVRRRRARAWTPLAGRGGSRR